MGQVVPDAVEAYLSSLNPVDDDLLRELAEEGRRLGLPLIDAEVGRLLEVLGRAVGARRILEIGTAIGYSALWLARSLPADGQLISIERNPERGDLARRYLDRSAIAGRATVMIGEASRLLYKLSGPYDLIFQDADKQEYGAMLDDLASLLRPGGLLVTDNVLWHGRVVPGLVAEKPGTGGDREPDGVTAAVAAFNRRLAADRRFVSSVIPLRDGLAIAVRT